MVQVRYDLARDPWMIQRRCESEVNFGTGDAGVNKFTARREYVRDRVVRL